MSQPRSDKIPDMTPDAPPLSRQGWMSLLARARPTRLAALFPHKRLQDPKIRLFIEHMVAACRKAVARLTG